MFDDGFYDFDGFLFGFGFGRGLGCGDGVDFYFGGFLDGFSIDGFGFLNGDGFFIDDRLYYDDDVFIGSGSFDGIRVLRGG